jgi:hypothetical protein
VQIFHISGSASFQITCWATAGRGFPATTASGNCRTHTSSLRSLSVIFQPADNDPGYLVAAWCSNRVR